MLNQQPLVKEILIAKGHRRSVDVPGGLLNLVTLKGSFLEIVFSQLKYQKGSNMKYKIWKREETAYSHNGVEAATHGCQLERE